MKERLMQKNTCGEIITEPPDGMQKAVWFRSVCTKLFAYEELFTLERATEIEKADREGRLAVLLVPIGAPVFFPLVYEDDDEVVRQVDELRVSGYTKEDGREFYTAYDDRGTCKLDTNDIHLTYEAAEAALAGQDETRQF